MDFNLKRSRSVFDANVSITADSSAQAGPEAMRNPLVSDSNACITFHHLQPASNGEPGPLKAFGPLMSHQIYGEGEEIKGYIEPRVDVTLSSLFLPLVEVSYKSKLLSDEQATVLLEPMKKAFAGEDGEGDNVVMTDRAAFDAMVSEEASELDAAVAAEDSGRGLLGDVVLREPIKGGNETLTIYRSTLADASTLVKKIHRRMEPLLLFFIDAASSIDAEDPCWEFLLCTVTDPQNKTRIVGMSTVYAFYVYPDQRRFRLSQAFVLPSEQGKGIGSAIVDAVFSVAKERHVIDITLEDPTDDFRRLRDRRDLRDMLACEWIMAKARKALGLISKANPDSSKSLQLGDESVKRLCKDLMMNVKQSERMWESLLYVWITVVRLGPASCLLQLTESLALALLTPRFKLALDTALDASNTDDGTLATVVEGWMAKNIEASFVGKDGETKAKEVAAGKLINDTPTGFWMYKDPVKAKAAAAGAAAAPPANVANMVPVSDVTDESQQQAIDEYIMTRINEVRTLVGAGSENE